MKITQIRSATTRLVYAGKTFLIDPWLAPPGMSSASSTFPAAPTIFPTR